MLGGNKNNRLLEDAIRERSLPATLDPLMERIADVPLVLLGEASHGTHEYYMWRSRITKRLIRERRFDFIAVEGDWPACYELNRFVKGWAKEESAADIVNAFNRWPTWMWANWEIVELADWLKKHNEGLPESEKVGFYGLDVYSLWESLDAVFDHLRSNYPEALSPALEALVCFEPFNRDAQTYAWSTKITADDCADEVIELLQSLRSLSVGHPEDPESRFDAEQNAAVAVGAERYYRAMVRGDSESWNIRDRHMLETLHRLLQRYETLRSKAAKGIVWEHNTHIGDARATDMADADMVNLGQLARERYGADQTILVGFAGYEGTVIAGESWGAPMETMRVPRAKEGSWEDVLHAALQGADALLLSNRLADVDIAIERRGHRAIGVVYHPDRERYGNYVPTVLPERYDALIYCDRTRALHPLHPTLRADSEPPDTYPWGE